MNSGSFDVCDMCKFSARQAPASVPPGNFCMMFKERMRNCALFTTCESAINEMNPFADIFGGKIPWRK
jgi:hypothetical protein